MVRLIKKEEKHNTVIYEYYPENTDNCGVIVFDKKTLEGDIERKADTDRFSRYAFKAIKKLKEFAKDGKFQDSALMAWY